MNSIETKETSTALGALAKAKGKRGDHGAVVQPIGIVVENKNTPVPVTPAPDPVIPATPAPAPATVRDDGRNIDEAYKHLKTKYDTEVSTLRRENTTLKTQVAEATAPKIALPKTKEEMEAYRKQYPEAMDVFQTLALETVASQSKELRDQLDEVKNYTKELKEREAFSKLLEIHPDAMEIRSSTEFLNWFNEQPPAIQNILADSTDIKAVAKQLSLYKLEVLGINPKEKKKQEAQSAVEASLGVNVAGRTEITAQKKIWTQTEINQICAHYPTWLKYRKELDDAARENRIDKTK